jgi:hypothetical protein
MLMHFFYLHANGHPQVGTDLYDFVLLIAGNQGARERYRARHSGKPYFKKEK